MTPTCFADLNQLLTDLTTSVQLRLGDNFVGVYLQGSFAVGDADEDSDVDFMVAIVEPLSQEEVTSLTAIHASLYEREGYWPKHLEGSYVPAAALRRYELNQPPWHYLDNGSLQFELSNHDNTNVVRWSLRNHGIVLAGTPVSELIDEVTSDMLKDEIAAVIRDWGNEILLADHDGINNGWLQPYLVLSFCRMLHSLTTGTIESKAAGARWALTALDARWHALIERAQAKRKGQFSRGRDLADSKDCRSTIEFVRYSQELALRF
jgi:predicted nucleotidyltransferase